MVAGRKKFAVIGIVILAVLAASGGTLAWSRYSGSQPIEITLAPEPELSGAAYLSGAIGSPGLYELKAGESLESLIRDAGGAAPDADLSRLRIHIPHRDDAPEPQKVDLNRAEAWLLEALPGVGAVRARDIIEYRTGNGGFRSPTELTNIKGFGPALYEQIKGLVTAGE